MITLWQTGQLWWSWGGVEIKIFGVTVSCKVLPRTSSVPSRFLVLSVVKICSLLDGIVGCILDCLSLIRRVSLFSWPKDGMPNFWEDMMPTSSPLFSGFACSSAKWANNWSWVVKTTGPRSGCIWQMVCCPVFSILSHVWSSRCFELSKISKQYWNRNTWIH